MKCVCVSVHVCSQLYRMKETESAPGGPATRTAVYPPSTPWSRLMFCPDRWGSDQARTLTLTPAPYQELGVTLPPGSDVVLNHCSDHLPGAHTKRRHQDQEDGRHHGCVWVYEAAAAGACGMGKVHPGLRGAPPWRPGEQESSRSTISRANGIFRAWFFFARNGDTK